MSMVKLGFLYQFFILQKTRIRSETRAADENGWTVHKMTIMNVSRSDDGLYTCFSENDGGKNEVKGHLTVECKLKLE